jgi:hypothetical protein
MKLHLVKRPDSCLEPDTDLDREHLRKVKIGSVLSVEAKKPRNSQHHRKLFKLLDLMFQNQQRYTSVEHMLVDIKIKAGHFDEYITREGQLVYVPKSISYGSMEQHDFERFYDRVLDIAVGDPDYLQGMTKQQLESAVMERMGFA